jgi:hypothetical protein
MPKASILKRLIQITAISVFLSVMSSCVPRKVIDVVPGSVDCDTGCLTAAARWPFAYIVDGHGLSPHGSADFIGMLLGLDKLVFKYAVLDCLIWFSAAAAGWSLIAKWRNRVR